MLLKNLENASLTLNQSKKPKKSQNFGFLTIMYNAEYRKITKKFQTLWQALLSAQ
jgi:hypothetical protein